MKKGTYIYTEGRARSHFCACVFTCWPREFDFCSQLFSSARVGLHFRPRAPIHPFSSVRRSLSLTARQTWPDEMMFSSKISTPSLAAESAATLWLGALLSPIRFGWHLTAFCCFRPCLCYFRESTDYIYAASSFLFGSLYSSFCAKTPLGRMDCGTGALSLRLTSHLTIAYYYHNNVTPNTHDAGSDWIVDWSSLGAWFLELSQREVLRGYFWYINWFQEVNKNR